MAFTQLMNCETSARYAAAECRPETPSLEEPPTPSGEEDTSAMLGDFAMGGECAQAMGPSTSYQPVEMLPLNFGDLDGEQQANTLFNKGPLRTLSARNFEALLDESGLENESWTALNNLPSLPRDASAIDLLEAQEAAAPAAPAPAAPAPTAESPSDSSAAAGHTQPHPLRASATDDDTDSGNTSSSDTDTVQEARDLAMQARARAEEARRFATQKTAAATALTIHAKEILDVAVTVKGGSMGGGRGSRSVSSNSAPDVLSERMGRGIAGAAASGDISSPPFTPAAGHKRARSFAIQPPTRKALKPAAPAPAPAAAVSSSGRLKKTPQKYIVADDDTDMEDFYEPPVTKAAAATAAAVVAAAAAVEAEVEAAAATESVEAAAAAAAMVPKPGGKSGGTKKSRAAAQKLKTSRGIQATDSIITDNGKKCRRGCLNCQAQKTPQWRMGPEGPKTLCNACGVRYRKGLPLVGAHGAGYGTA